MSKETNPHLDLDAFEEELEGTTLLRLRGEDPREHRWAPEDADLIRFARDRGSLEAGLAARIDAYLEAHPAERDALAAFESVAPAEVATAAAAAPASFAQRLRERLSSALEGFGGATRAVGAAASLALVLGVGVLLTPAEETMWRGGEEEIQGEEHLQIPAGDDLVEISLAPGVPIPIEASTLPVAGTVMLTLAYPGEIPAGTIELRLVREGAAAPLVQQTRVASVGALSLSVPADQLEPGEYRVEVREVDVDALPLEFPLQVR